MKTKVFSATKIKRYLQRYKIATMEVLKKVLGTDVRMTVFRKLKELSFRTSYSHRGKFYALGETIRFEAEGLWSSGSVWFSSDGTLLETARTFVHQSEAGYSVKELQGRLHVSVKEPLGHLFKGKEIERKKVSGVYVYFATDSAVRAKQMMLRRESEEEGAYRSGKVGETLLFHELKATIVLFASLLNEKQKRLYAGLESLKLGHGGDKIIAELLGLNGHTVGKGRQELLERDVAIERVRRKGGGRSSIKKNS